MRILFATDGSDCARNAVRQLCDLPPPAGSELRLLGVLERSLFSEGEQAQLAEAQRTALHRQCERMEAELATELGGHERSLRTAGFDVDAAVRSGSAAKEILNEAERWRADLIVVGSHGQGGASRFLLGSVSDHVLRYAHCSVWVVRPSSRTAVERVLLAYDDSPPARGAEAFLATLGLDVRVQIRVLSVLPLVKLFRQDVKQQLSRAWQQKRLLAEQALARIAADSRWGRRGNLITELREADDVSEAILEYADEARVDLIVLGHKGKSLLQRLLLGSATARVVHHAHCSVLVVRDPQ